jgi:riboflavin synthase
MWSAFAPIFLADMFSGIVETTASIHSAQMCGRCRCVSIEKPRGWKLGIGESVNIDGICSTVVAQSTRSFDVEYMPETLSKTTAGAFDRDRLVNLERSLVWGGRVHGHFVSGHVDARGTVLRIQKKGRSSSILFSIPRTLAPYVSSRGSITINGVSLTIARLHKRGVEVALIPHTLQNTNLGSLKLGDAVNIECDLIARYRAAKRGAKVQRHATKTIGKKGSGR